MRWIAAIVLFVISTPVFGGEVRPNQQMLNSTIDRGLVFLARDTMTWKKEHNCVACHHAGLEIWSMREAKQRGRAVDEQVLAELTKWVEDTNYGAPVEPIPPGATRRLNA